MSRRPQSKYFWPASAITESDTEQFVSDCVATLRQEFLSRRGLGFAGKPVRDRCHRNPGFEALC